MLVDPAHAHEVGPVAQAQQPRLRAVRRRSTPPRPGRARSAGARRPGTSARRAGARPPCGSRTRRRPRRCPRNTGRYSAGSSCAAGWRTAGTRTLPMAATVGMVEVGVEGDDVGVGRADGVDERRPRRDRCSRPTAFPAPGSPGGAPAAPARRGRRSRAAARAADDGGARAPRSPRSSPAPARRPRCGVERAGRVDLGLPARAGAQVLGQLARRRLGTAHHLGPVPRGDEGDLRAHRRHRHRRDGVDQRRPPPRPRTARPPSGGPRSTSAARRRSSVQTRCSAAAT